MKTSLILAALLLSSLCAGKDQSPASAADIRQVMIQESIAAYPSNCPCPYNSAKNGSSCGRRSAYSRPGGRSPLCYPQDISDAMVEEYRRKHLR